jgi:fucose permease
VSDTAAPDAPATSAPPSVRRWPRIAVTVVFVVHGLLFASWTAHIPEVKAHLGLTDGTLGFALLGAPVGSVTVMIASAYLLPKLGSRRIVQIALLGYCAAGQFVGLTATLPALFGALFAWGAFQGTLDVAMNTQAIAIERAGRRVLMSGLHGSWSIGSFVGAGIGALAVGAGVTLSAQLLILGTLALLAAGLLTTRMLPDAGDQQSSAADSRAGNQRPRTASRWSGGMVLLTRYRPDRLLPALAVLATIGFTAGLLTGRPAAALAGFASLGIGLASVVPAVFSAAGHITGLHPGTAVATASACGWAGFVCGPPLIGQIASLTSLPAALGLLPLLTAFILVGTSLARALKTQPQHHGRPAGAGSTP